MDLAEFIAARLDEDERSATPGRQSLDDLRFELKREGDWYEQHLSSRIEDGLDLQTAAWEARVLREVAAKRAILDEHSPGYETYYPKPSGRATCAVCHAGGWDWEPKEWPCPTIRALVSAWSEHPDYDQAWAPQHA